MHVVFICNEYPPAPHGGIGTMTQLLATHLVQRGHKVSVLGINRHVRDVVETRDGVHVMRLSASPVPKTGFLVNGWKLRRAISRLHRESPVDVIEGPEDALALLSRRSPIPRVIRMNGGHHFFADLLGGKPTPWRSFLEARSFVRADRLAAVTTYVAEETRRLLQLGDVDIEILPNPVDTARFRPLPVAEVRGRIVFFGTFVEKKGLRQLVAAMPLIAAEVPEAHLVAIGKETYDENGRPFSRRCLAEIGKDVAARVKFVEHIAHEELPNHLAEASVVACPSHMEAFGMVWSEAMACGRAVVGSKTGPGREVIDDGRSGLLCDPFDPRDIAQVIIRLLRDDELRKRLAEEGKKRSAAFFSLGVLVPRNEGFYAEVIDTWASRNS